MTTLKWPRGGTGQRTIVHWRAVFLWHTGWCLQYSPSDGSWAISSSSSSSFILIPRFSKKDSTFFILICVPWERRVWDEIVGIDSYGWKKLIVLTHQKTPPGKLSTRAQGNCYCIHVQESDTPANSRKSGETSIHVYTDLSLTEGSICGRQGDFCLFFLVWMLGIKQALPDILQTLRILKNENIVI